MATDNDILVSRLPTKPKQYEVGLTPQEQLIQKLDSQVASHCNMVCPICQSEGYSGACGLSIGHAGVHMCNRVSSHAWNELSTDVPGPR